MTGARGRKGQMEKFRKAVIIFIAQGAYTGRFPVAPGTAGTLAAIPLYYFVMLRLSATGYIAVCLVLFLIGTWAAGHAETLLNRKDSPSIVIDEIVGYLLAMFLLPLGWGFVIAGFFLFRVFDVLKPYPLNSLQKIRGGLGVMIDDIGAAVYTNVVLRVVAAVLEKQ